MSYAQVMVVVCLTESLKKKRQVSRLGGCSARIGGILLFFLIKKFHIFLLLYIHTLIYTLDHTLFTFEHIFFAIFQVYTPIYMFQHILYRLFGYISKNRKVYK